MYKPLIYILTMVAVFAAATAQAQTPGPANHYAVFLSGASVASQFATRTEMEVGGCRHLSAVLQLATAQRAMRTRLAAAHINVTASVSTLMNAIFVVASDDRIAEIRAMPGVADVMLLGRRKLLLNKATTLIGGPAAWTRAGGFSNAGKGIRIAVLDTGIDQNHPSLQDSTLTPASKAFPSATRTMAIVHSQTAK